MSSELKFLAYDLGASSGRSVVGLLNDGKLRLEEVNRFHNGPVGVGDSLYWDVLRLFDEMKQGLRLAVQNYGKDIAGVGMDTWGVDFGLLGPNDVLMGNPHNYRDSRTDGMIEVAEAIVPRAEMYAQTGIQFMQFNTIFQLLALSKTDPWMLETARSMLLMPDLFNFWFTGAKVNEFSNATTTQMFNPQTCDWARPLLGKLGIPTHILCDIVQPGTVIGNLLPSLADETGAGRIPFVAPATHDTGSAVAAVPATGQNHIYISSGTWSLMGIESDKPIVNEKALELNFTNEGGVCNTFRFLKNIVGLWIIQECRRVWALEGKDYSFGQMADMAANARPYRSIIDTDDALFLKPGNMPARIAEYCIATNQPVPENDGEIIRTALDGLALKYRSVRDGLEDLTGRTFDTIHIIGGGTQNRLLCQLTADVTGLQVIAGPVEATAIGNILMQAIGLGHVGSLSDAREIVRNSFEVVTYDPRPDSRIDAAYEKLTSLIG